MFITWSFIKAGFAVLYNKDVNVVLKHCFSKKPTRCCTLVVYYSIYIKRYSVSGRLHLLFTNGGNPEQFIYMKMTLCCLMTTSSYCTYIVDKLSYVKLLYLIVLIKPHPATNHRWKRHQTVKQPFSLSFTFCRG